MIAKNTIKVNGKWFYAGQEIADVDKNTSNYTKTEINRMSTTELKSFAKEQGISDSEDMTGTELKKTLIEKLGL